MASNSFGQVVRITTFGESHGAAVGVILDGCPAGHRICMDRLQAMMQRRRPGQSHLSSPRQEQDVVECLSGIQDGITLGTPIALVVRNKDQKKGHYSDLKQVYRPSHADYTTETKYGIRPGSGGGRASARETVGRVAAAAVAEQVLEQLVPGIRIVAYVDQVHKVEVKAPDPSQLTRELVDATPLRCGDNQRAAELEAPILEAKRRGDSVGGTLCCYITGVPVGLGDPTFHKLEAQLAAAMLSLPACKGFEVGSGFNGTRLFGSEHNDAYIIKEGQVGTATNRSGGIQGGISNGEDIYFRVAFKPVATIFRQQQSVTSEGEEVTMQPKQGRHDPCVLPRAVPIVEAMTSLVLLDHFVRQSSIQQTRGSGPDLG